MQAAVIVMFGAAAAVVTGCAGRMNVEMQEIQIATTPPGAECRVERRGREIISSLTTPATVRVSPGAAPLTVSCNRAGYLPVQRTEASVGATLETPSTLVDGLIGLATEGDVNARNRYAGRIDIAMEPDPSLPASLKDVKPVAPVAVQPLDDVTPLSE